MASSEHPEADETAASATPVRRMLAYLCVCLALAVVLWALIEGGDRDLWTGPSGLLTSALATSALGSL